MPVFMHVKLFYLTLAVFKSFWVECNNYWKFCMCLTSSNVKFFLYIPNLDVTKILVFCFWLLCIPLNGADFKFVAVSESLHLFAKIKTENPCAQTFKKYFMLDLIESFISDCFHNCLYTTEKCLYNVLVCFKIKKLYGGRFSVLHQVKQRL